MNLIFEGIDKAGKSTLIHEITKQLIRRGYFVYNHKNAVKPDSDLTIWNHGRCLGKLSGIYLGMYQLANHISFRKTFHLFDRGHITEIVYGKVKRHYNVLNYINWPDYEEKYLKDNTLVIYCTASYSDIEKRFLSDNEDKTKIEEVAEIMDQYDKYFEKSKLRRLEVSSSGYAYEKNAEFIINYLISQEWISAKEKTYSTQKKTY